MKPAMLFVLACSTLSAANGFKGELLRSPGLIGYWVLGESASPLADSSVSGSTGIGAGGITYSQTGPIPTDASTAITLNGSTGYVDVANYTPYNFERTSKFGGCAWYKPTGTGNYTIASKMLSDATLRGWWFVVLNGAVEFWLINDYGGGSYLRVSAFSTSTDGVWNHACFSYDGSSTAAGVQLWWNGLQQPNSVLSDALSATTVSVADLNLGARNAQGCCYFTGSLGQIQIWNRQITGNEVLHYYTVANKSFNTFANNTVAPPGAIYDNDSCESWDNMAATAHVAAWTRQGYINLLAYVESSNNANGVVVQDLILRSWGLHPAIGTYPGGTGDASDNVGCAAYVTLAWPGRSRANYSSAASVLRTTLTAAANASVIYLIAGTMQNLYDLMNDGGSPSGATLIASKVTKMIFPAGSYPGPATEYNFVIAPTAANYVLSHWPNTVPIEFMDNQSLTAGCANAFHGQAIYTSASPGMPLYQLTNAGVRTTAGIQAWDDCGILRGILDPSNVYFGTAASNGTNTVTLVTGSNLWTSVPNNAMSYLNNVATFPVIDMVMNTYLYQNPGAAINP